MVESLYHKLYAITEVKVDLTPNRFFFQFEFEFDSVFVPNGFFKSKLNVSNPHYVPSAWHLYMQFKHNDISKGYTK